MCAVHLTNDYFIYIYFRQSSEEISRMTLVILKL